jgi:hypothetical protein
MVAYCQIAIRNATEWWHVLDPSRSTTKITKIAQGRPVDLNGVLRGLRDLRGQKKFALSENLGPTALNP